MKFYCDDLTIVLPLLNREQFTERYLRYLERIKFPFQIFIADGGTDKDLQKILQEKKIARSVRYTYMRFPQDKTLLDYYSKMKNVLKLVESPYVMFNDNDDFPIFSGIYKALDFLKSHSDYVGATGKIGGVSVLFGDKCISPWTILHDSCYDGATVESFEQENSLARIQYQLTKNRATNLFYGIYKTNEVQKVVAELEELNCKDLRLFEGYFIQALMAVGKIKYLDQNFSYIRQRDTSYGTTLLTPWCKDLFFKNWLSEFDQYSQKIAERIIQSADNKKLINETKNVFKDYFLEYLLKPPFFEKHMGQKLRNFSCYKSNILKYLISIEFFRKKYCIFFQRKFFLFWSSQKDELQVVVSAFSKNLVI